MIKSHFNGFYYIIVFSFVSRIEHIFSVEYLQRLFLPRKFVQKLNPDLPRKVMLSLFLAAVGQHLYIRTAL